MLDYPKYRVKVNGNPKWISRADGLISLLNSGMADVRLCGTLMEENGNERNLTEEEEKKIWWLVDEYSADV